MKTQNTIFSLIAIFGVSLSVSAREFVNNSPLEMDTITYLEEEEIASLDFDTSEYLPEDFNPYAAPSNFMHISFIKGKDAVELGFDTKQYLPEAFNPHRYFFDINSVDYIEEEVSDPYMDVQRFLQGHSVPPIGR